MGYGQQRALWGWWMTGEEVLIPPVNRPPLTSGPITPSITIYRLHDMRYPSLSHGYTSFISSKFPFLDESIHTHTSESKNIMTSNLPNSSKISQKNFLYKFDTGTYSSPMHELIIDLDLIEMNPPCFCVYSVQLSTPVCLCTQTFQWSPDKLDVFITAISYPNSHKIIDSPYTSIRPRGQFKPRYKGHRGYLLSPGKRPKLGRES